MLFLAGADDGPSFKYIATSFLFPMVPSLPKLGCPVQAGLKLRDPQSQPSEYWIKSVHLAPGLKLFKTSFYFVKLPPNKLEIHLGGDLL